jgi:hypothetical protein
MLLSFSQIVEANTSFRQRRELYKALQSAGLCVGLRTAIDNYFNECKSATKEEKQQKFSAMVFDVLTQINHWHQSQGTANEHKPSARRVIQLGFILLKQIVISEPCMKHTYLSLLEDMIEKDLLTIDWKDFSLLFFGAEVLLPVRSNNNAATVKKRQKTGQPQAYLLWHPKVGDKIKQAYFTFFPKDICEVLQDVGPQSSIDKLFIPGCSDYHIIVPYKYLRPFIALFRLLIKSGRISCCHSKGFYRLLQSRVIFPEHEKRVKIKDFNKFDFETRSNPRHEADASEILRPLLEKYIPEQSLQAKSNKQKSRRGLTQNIVGS